MRTSGSTCLAGWIKAAIQKQTFAFLSGGRLNLTGGVGFDFEQEATEQTELGMRGALRFMQRLGILGLFVGNGLNSC